MTRETRNPPAPTPGTPHTRLKTFHSLIYRDYRLLWLAQIGASGALWMDQVARPLLIFKLTESALLMGLLAATRMVPMLLLGIWAGVLADRMDKRRILLSSQLTTLFMHLATALLIFTDLLRPWMMFVVAFVGGVSMAFQQPARQSLIPHMVPDKSLANAIALYSVAQNSMRIGGAMMAGVALIFLDFGGFYLLLSILYVWVTLCTFHIRVRTVEDNHTKEKSSVYADLAEGFRAVKRDRAILCLLSLSLMLFVWGFPYQSVFVPLISLKVLDIGNTGVSLLMSITGIGALGGALLVARAGGSMKRRGLVMLGIILTYSLALLVFSRAETLFLAIPALLLTGAMQTSFMSLNNTFVLERTPKELQGRIMSLFHLDRGLIPLGASIGGILASEMGPQDGLFVMASICLLGTLLLAILVPSLRRLA